MAGAKIEPITNSMPGFGGGTTSTPLTGYSVRYFKANLDEGSDVLMLEKLETEGMAGERIVLMNKETFTFQDNFFVVLTYLEKQP